MYFSLTCDRYRCSARASFANIAQIIVLGYSLQLGLRVLNDLESFSVQQVIPCHIPKGKPPALDMALEKKRGKERKV